MERNRFVSTLGLCCAFPSAESGSGARPRVEGEREQEILAATLDVLLEEGYDNLTMDAVASRAKASKATLYRRWEDKATLVIAALKQMKGPMHAADTGTLRGDLLATYCGHDAVVDPESMALFTCVATAVSRDPDLAVAWKREVFEPKLALTHEIWERARARGEITADVDLELIESTVSGVVLQRILLDNAGPDTAFITKVIDQIVLPAIGVQQPAPLQRESMT